MMTKFNKGDRVRLGEYAEAPYPPGAEPVQPGTEGEVVVIQLYRVLFDGFEYPHLVVESAIELL